jgi:hypothetical protein
MSSRSGFFRFSWSILGGVLAWAPGCDGGGGHDPRFLPFEQLCPELAADICGARNGGCCAGVDPLQCEKDEEARCGVALGALQVESSRRYDAVAAARQHELTRAALSACGAQPVLAAFFQGGLSLGAMCERSGQCGSGNCSPDGHVCVDAVSPTLCAAPVLP